MLKDVYASEDLNDTSNTNTQSNAMTSSINSKLVDLFGTSDLKDGNSNRSTGGQTLDIPKDIFEKTKDPEWKKANREKYEYSFSHSDSTGDKAKNTRCYKPDSFGGSFVQ